MIRYRTHDLTRIIPGQCPCGSPYPRIDTILGRTDDMVKVKGVNIFPSQIDEILAKIEGASSEYRLEIDRMNGKDSCVLFLEQQNGAHTEQLKETIQKTIKSKIGLSIEVNPVAIGTLPRSEKKTARVLDNRY